MGYSYFYKPYSELDGSPAQKEIWNPKCPSCTCEPLYLELWQQEAETIPNSELRKQALLSIESKAFHCEGGAIYGLLAQDKIEPTIRFIVAYQTICDYLDNLCDRSTSLDPRDFRTLQQACIHALTPDANGIDYYQFREDRDDGGYLIKLV